MKRIGVWGDSITWGAADQQMGGWVARLRNYYDNLGKDNPAVYNVGVGGDKVLDVLERFDVEYKSRRPELVILAIGINDSPHDSTPEGTLLSVFEQRYIELIDKIKGVVSKLIVVGLTNVDDQHPDHHGYSDRTTKPYDEVIKKVAESRQLPYVDLWGVITSEDLKLDGLHPEAAGHQKIFEKVKLTISDLGHSSQIKYLPHCLLR